MRYLVVGTAGHIDHGKSALVQALTGTDPDRLKEEKARGITIDLGFAHWATPDLTVAFVDVPGHERFVKNMLAGVGGIDAVVLVVAADESVMPQTREHFDICRLLQVPTGLVALTKVDLVDHDTLEIVRMETRDLVRGSFLDGAPMIPVSARTGAGLDDLKDALVRLGGRTTARAAAGIVRLPVDRAFSMKGFGTVVTGTLVSGSVRLDDELSVLPRGLRVKVRGLQVHGARQERAVAGQRVAVNLGGIEVADVDRGDTLGAPGTLTTTRVIDVRIESLATAKPIRHGARVRFHQGTSEVLGRLAISAVVDGGGDPGLGAAEIPAGRSAFARLRLESETVLTRGDRFILRAYSPPLTIGGGIVLDPRPPRLGIRTPNGRARFAVLDPLSPGSAQARDEQAALAMIGESGVAGFPSQALVSRVGLAADAARTLADALVAGRRVARIDDTLIPADALRSLSAAVTRMLGDYHRAQPLSEGMPREEVRERLAGKAAAGVFDHVIAGLADAGKIVAGGRLALSGHRVALSEDETRARDGIAQALREAGLRPPDSAELAASLGIKADLLARVTGLLVRQRVLVKVDALLFHEEALSRLKHDIADLKRTAPGGVARVDVAAFKERYGITRKFAIPLLEYLDRERVTRRMGDTRLVI